jgi:ABC-2 type transport system permease protein
MKIVSIAWHNLIRMFRERANLFFVLIFPILIIAVLGSQFGDSGEAPQIGITRGSEFAERAADRLTDTGAARVVWFDSGAELRDQVSTGSLAAGVVVPDDADTRLETGGKPQLTVLLSEDEEAAQLDAVAQRAFAAEAMEPGVVRQLTELSGRPAGEVRQAVSHVASGLTPIETTRQVAGGGEPEDDPIGFSQIAVGILLLMTFLNALTGASALIQSRRLGVSRRMISTPTSVRTIVIGEGFGRWGVGMFQALYIMIATALLFDVAWGDLPTAIVVLALFAAVAAGAAMLIGAIMQNDEQAAGVTVLAGLALGALGGTMLPLELYNSTMNSVAHITPHAWAIDAFTEMGRHGATLVDVLPEVGVLGGMAVLLIALASWRLRVTLTRL